MVAMTAASAKGALRKAATPARAKVNASYFKTGPGEYGEGDVFLGVTMPDLRLIAREYRALDFAALETLLGGKVHEERALASVILADRAGRADEAEGAALARFYLKHIDRFDNWDLIDQSAPYVLGPYFAGRSRARLHALARSKSMWRRRISILSTQHFIRAGETAETFALATRLLDDEHDLIHKGVGWMLREAGKRDRAALLRFLDQHAATMPRTMLRYAIERLAPAARKRYMAA